MKKPLTGIALMPVFFAVPATGAVINVDEGCTLADAITAANTDTVEGGWIP